MQSPPKRLAQDKLPGRKKFRSRGASAKRNATSTAPGQSSLAKKQTSRAPTARRTQSPAPKTKISVAASRQTAPGPKPDLDRALALLQMSQEAGGTGSFEWNVRTGQSIWSENQQKMLGLWPSAFDGTFAAWQKRLHPADARHIDAELKTVFAEKRPDWTSEHRIIRADNGEQRWFTSRAKISYDRRGKPLSMIGVSIDITDRKAVEQELVHSRKDLENHVHQRTAELVQKTLEMSQQARQLDEANFSLRQLSARILHLQDEERRRIASHLHDSTGSWLTALAMNLSVLKAEAAKLSTKSVHVLDDSLEIIREMSDDLRTVSHLLHPPLLDEMGLQSALRWFVEEFSKRSKIPVDLTIDERLGRLTRECETVIFRIVQEALTNVHRHSGSERASISLVRKDGELALEVRDWGRGLLAHPDGAPKQSGVGIRGMRERVRQLGGTFDLRRNPDGTSVLAKFTDASVCLVPQPASAG